MHMIQVFHIHQAVMVECMVVGLDEMSVSTGGREREQMMGN